MALFREIQKKVMKALPEESRFKLIRSMVKVPRQLPAELDVHIASSEDELETAFTLLHNAYVDEGYMKPSPAGIRVTPYHALPSTTTIVACWQGRVVGTVSIIRESAYGLPLQKVFDTNALKEQGHRCAEISSLAVHEEFRRHGPVIFFSLLKYVYEYCLKCFGADIIVIAVNPKHVDMYRAMFGFERLPTSDIAAYDFANGAPAVGLYHSFRGFHDFLERHYPRQNESNDLFSFFAKWSYDSFHYPNREDWTVDDPVMSPALMKHFFVDRCDIFSTLTEQEKLVLWWSYPYSDYVDVLPACALHQTQADRRQEARFDVQCAGRISFRHGERQVHIEVLDASVHGFRARLAEGVRFGEPVHVDIMVAPFEVAKVECMLVRQSAPTIYSFRIVEPDNVWAHFMASLRDRLGTVGKLSALNTHAGASSKETHA